MTGSGPGPGCEFAGGSFHIPAAKIGIHVKRAGHTRYHHIKFDLKSHADTVGIWRDGNAGSNNSGGMYDHLSFEIPGFGTAIKLAPTLGINLTGDMISSCNFAGQTQDATGILIDNQTGALTRRISLMGNKVSNLDVGLELGEFSRNISAIGNIFSGNNTDINLHASATRNSIIANVTNRTGTAHINHVDANRSFWFGSIGENLGSPQTGTITWDPPNLASDGDTATATVRVDGAAIGDPCIVGHTGITQTGAILTGHVTQADFVRATLHNKTGGALNVASGTLRAVVTKFI